jgi:hypothetical protein
MRQSGDATRSSPLQRREQLGACSTTRQLGAVNNVGAATARATTSEPRACTKDGAGRLLRYQAPIATDLPCLP